MSVRNPNSKKTDAERRAQNKWSAANKIILAAKVSTATGEAFRAWCAARGVTVNAALSSYVADCLRGDADGGAAPAPEIVQAAQPGQAAGADALTLPEEVARLARHAAKLAGTAPATWARQVLESAAEAEADAFERKQAALSAFEKFWPEQTAPGNSGDLPPEQAGSKTPGD